MTYRKKLIEVSLPLEAINVACQTEKYNPFLKGHPRSLHHWWARRPLAACRAVLFSSLVDDPSEYMPDEESARIERERIFGIIEKLVLWENSNDEEILYTAQLEIAHSVARSLNVDAPVGKEAVRVFLATKAPPVLDPFAGGGSIPLEAQRLGLRAYASDLNPVAVLINKALIEIPPKFANMPPVHPPESTSPALVKDIGVRAGRKKKAKPQDELWGKEWKGAHGLAEDVRYYGKWMREEAFKRIGHLYPPVTVTKEMLAERSDLKEKGFKPGDQQTVIAWLWARTVKCPNPACGAQMPLVRSFLLSSKGKEKYWIETKIDKSLKPPKIEFIVKKGNKEIPVGTVKRTGARCIACDTPVSFEYIRLEGQAERMTEKLMAIVTNSSKGTLFFSPDITHEKKAITIEPTWKPDTNLPDKALGFRVQVYGMNTHASLFLKRQLLALTTFCDLYEVVKEKIITDIKNNPKKEEYVNAVLTYLGIAISQITRYSVTICIWNTTNQNVVQAFSRQAIPMTWDFAESNPLEGKLTLDTTASWVASAIENLGWDGSFGSVQQKNASHALINTLQSPLIVTDPPYYDNIGYADLSDFFYVWLRPFLQNIYADIFSTVLTPKSQELIASPFRYDGDRGKAEESFLFGLGSSFNLMKNTVDSGYPTSIFYAYKQSEGEDTEEATDQQPGISSTGWETMLSGLLNAGYSILGTWPMRTERPTGVKVGANALASSIVLVCRPRPQDAPSSSRREFLSALKKELALALRELQQGSIAPVDLAQASIGPGMAIYSRYSAVLEADGKPMSVRTALTLINQALDEFLAEQEGEYDGDTRWALTWFEQYGHNEAAYGVAETLSRAKNTSVDGLSEANIVEARGGKVRLYRREELDTDWDPTLDKRLTAWESAAHLIYALENGGEESAAELLAKLGPVAEVARDLAYRLYTVCERKGWAQDALGYNMLVVAWPRLKELASRRVEPGQGKLM